MFRKLLLTAALLLPTQAHAQESWLSQLTSRPRVMFCSTIDHMWSNMEADGFRRSSFGYAEDESGTLIRLTTIWLREDGMYAVVETYKDTTSCIITSGENHQLVKKELPKKGASKK